MDPEPQCDAQGNYNVAYELQSEILSGRYLIGKRILGSLEESAIAAVASAIAQLARLRGMRPAPEARSGTFPSVVTPK
jgi:hypothetical protein